MSGNKLFLDTNIVIYFLSGNQTLGELIDKKTIYVSFITQLELLSYHELSNTDEEKINEFLSDSTIIDINSSIKNEVVKLRKSYRLKLPDSIIIAALCILIYR